MSHDGGADVANPAPPKQEKPVTACKPGVQESSSSSKTASKSSSSSSSPQKPIGVLGQLLRFLLLDLPLLLLLSLYAGMHLADWAKEEFFSAQYEGLMWDGTRKAEEIT